VEFQNLEMHQALKLAQFSEGDPRPVRAPANDFVAFPMENGIKRRGLA
jgi:hypothetical protein